MSKELIDVVDTAVKIGLGSLITGVFTYLGIKLSHDSEKKKFMLEHKTKLLEHIAEDVEAYFSAWDSYVSKVSGIARHRKRTGKEEDALSQVQRKSIKERDFLLTESWARRESAIAKLRLMKSYKAAKSLSSCTNLEKELRDLIVFDRDMPTYDQLLKYRERLREAKKKVHKDLSDFYATLET